MNDGQHPDPAASADANAAFPAGTAAAGSSADAVAPAPRRFEDLPPAAQRALKEAEARRAAASSPDLPREIDGRGGPEPVRYGDWEIKGVAVDF
ncbi:hypothetical protein HDIA_0286 [Hartmannibacter diazotrophicus]|uniref:DUF1674 domain-containing protein n=1 Tax=Hartmannibacter diazotrophicus TaxID=1482074 RepID=A0A2C9D0B3_9HYPH|nr:hypothetical protein HDIA_0286 [Hartmannibacter diazotrophicus]